MRRWILRFSGVPPNRQKNESDCSSVVWARAVMSENPNPFVPVLGMDIGVMDIIAPDSGPINPELDLRDVIPCPVQLVDLLHVRAQQRPYLYTALCHHHR